MSIAVAQELQNSNRYVLVRLTPARHVSTQLSADGGGVYSMTFNYPIARVERNGATLTETATTPPGSNDQWYHDETTGSFKVKLAAAPSATTNVIVIFYYLFFTDGVDVKAHETPSDTSTPLRLWEPRLIGEPSVSQAFSDVLEGTFSVRASTLSIANSDSYMHAFLTDDDSFYRKECRSWLCIVSTANVQQIFSGRVTGMSLSATAASINLSDAFAELSQPAYMGDTTQDAYFRKEADSFPDINLKDHGTPCTYIFGRSVTALADHPNAVVYLSNVQTQGLAFSIDRDKCNKATCIDYTSEASGTTNRTWGLCRLDGSLKTLDFGTTSSQTVLSSAGGSDNFLTTESGGRQILRILYAAHDHNLEVGDSFQFSGLNAQTHGATVVYVSSDGLTVYAKVSTSSAMAAGATVTAFFGNSAPALSIYDSTTGKIYDLVEGFDFGVSETALASGNKYVEITLGDNFETDQTIYYTGGVQELRFDGLGSLDPSKHELIFRATAANAPTHGDAMTLLVEAAGLTANATTFTQADTDLVANVSFTIPSVGESDYGKYLKYCQAIASSTLGYLSVNDSQQIDYRLLEAPGAGASNQTDNIASLDSVEIAYDDIATEIRAENPHFRDNLASSSVVESSAKARYLHGVDRRELFDHVLTDISGRISAILAFRSNRRVTYSLGVASHLTSADLGDDLTLENDRLLGGDSTQNVKITSITKSSHRILVQLMDLLGL